jgi:hypothetical protein
MDNHRTRVADLWDGYLKAWIEGDDALEDWTRCQDPSLERDLDSWQRSYTGLGRGALDLSCFPDPYTGDIRGNHGEPLLVTLGLNPGIGYPELQGRSGVWTNRIREVSLSKCFNRSPPGDRDWLRIHGGESIYWRNLLRFGNRWCGNDFDFSRLLNFELYPWHSISLTSQIRCPPKVVSRYVLQPLAEFQVRHIFAFGRAWDGVCRGLGFQEVCRFGEGCKPFPGVSTPGWTVVLFRSSLLPASIVVSWQKGYAGPPGSGRLETLRKILDHEY